IGAFSNIANQAAAQAPTSKAEQALRQASAQQKYSFLLFYKDNGSATQAMAKTLQDGVGKRADRATFCFVDVNDPAEKAIVDRFGASRTPLPLTIAVAPNGAMTGIFPKSLSDEHLADSFVTPTMTKCMKSMQEGKLVLVCVYGTAQATVPLAVEQFCA